MFRIVLVVVPVHVPMGIVVLPYQPARLGRLSAGDVIGEGEGALEVAALATGLPGGEHRLAQVHVGVLAAVGAEVPVGVGLVAVEPGLGFPETPFQELPGFLHPGGGVEAGLARAGVGEQHEGDAVGMVGAVLGAAVADRPGITAGGRVAVHLAQIGESVAGHVQVRGRSEFARGHRIVVDEARAAHQVAMAGVVDASVVLEVLEKTAGRVEHVRLVEGEDAGDVLAQEGGTAKIGKGGKRVHGLGVLASPRCRRSGRSRRRRLRVRASRSRPAPPAGPAGCPDRPDGPRRRR